MKNFVALISGGKDSIYAICKLIKEGYVLKAIVHITPATKTIDSYMFQTVGTEIIQSYERCLNVPLFIAKTDCNAVNKEMEYYETENDEVEDLYEALLTVKKTIDFEFVSSGAILSEYQKNRVENVCKRLGVMSVAPLYGLDQKELLKEMIEYGIDARVVKIAGGGLTKNAINKDLEYIKMVYNGSKFKNLNYCGEGGEFETVVIDCPIFEYKINIKKNRIFRHEDEVDDERSDAVFYMKIDDFELDRK